MLTRISSTPKNYSWGSATAIPRLLGTAPDGRPQAELWLGAHPDSVTTLVDAAPGVPATLNEWVQSDPASTLGGGSRLPFLLKLLAAERPLSLQAHPTLDRARAGFADENARGVARDSPARNYKDEWHKPELMVALHDGFAALCGFRPVVETGELLDHLLGAVGGESRVHIEAFRRSVLDEGLEAAVGSVLLGDSRPLVDAVTAAARAAGARPTEGPWPGECRLIQTLDRHYPGDPGIAVATLLNYMELREGQALYLPAGNIHAYVHGLGIEIMAASDNVLRGGLTDKGVDIPELLAVLDFSPMPPPLVEPVPRPGGYAEYPTPLPDFRLVRVDAADAELELENSAIVIAVAGGASLGDGTTHLSLQQGEAVFVTPTPALSLRAAGTVFVATSGPREGEERDRSPDA
jgi:mannose-6-phosphate isomerase